MTALGDDDMIENVIDDCPLPKDPTNGQPDPCPECTARVRTKYKYAGIECTKSECSWRSGRGPTGQGLEPGTAVYLAPEAPNMDDDERTDLDPCPECGGKIEAREAGGLACTACDWWFCF